PGSLVLLGGDPGIGKSTLLLQALEGMAAGAPSDSARARRPLTGEARQALPGEGGREQRPPLKVLYVSGEESVRQTALRASRLGAQAPSLLVLAETRLERILDEAMRIKPDVLAIDSIQTVHAPSLESIPGSLGQ